MIFEEKYGTVPMEREKEQQMKRLGNANAWNAAGKCLSAAALICGGLMGILIAWVSLLNLSAETSPITFALLYLAAGTGIVLAVIALCRAVPAKSELRFCICLAAAAFAVRGVFVLLIPSEPASDFNAMYAAACELAQGNNILNDTPYFQWWSYQSGFVAWMAFWIRLFGADVFFFQMTNCLCGAGCAVLVCALARRFASPQGARAAGILYLIYPGSIVFAPVLTNQHLSELLLLTALYVATGEGDTVKSRLLRGGAAGLLLALSNAVRPSAVVMVLAVLAVLILELFRWKELGRRGLLPVAAGVLAIAAVYVLSGEALSWLVRITELNRNGLTNNVPEWKFISGLNQESHGGYSDADAELVFTEAPVEQIRENARQLLRERLADLTPDRLLALFWLKIKAMWGGFEPAWWAMTQNVMDAYAARGQMEALAWWHSKLERLSGGVYIADSLLISAGCVRAALREERGRSAALLLALTALAYFCVHLLIEVQSRYRTLLFAVALPLAAIGADWLAEWCGRLLVRRKEKRKET